MFEFNIKFSKYFNIKTFYNFLFAENFYPTLR